MSFFRKKLYKSDSNGITPSALSQKQHNPSCYSSNTSNTAPPSSQVTQTPSESIPILATLATPATGASVQTSSSNQTKPGTVCSINNTDETPAVRGVESKLPTSVVQHDTTKSVTVTDESTSSSLPKRHVSVSGILGAEDYTMIKTIGTGTFGRVYLCTNSKQNEYYAMKICRKVDIVRLKQVEHIRSERAILAFVQHPFIIHMYASYQDSVHLYMLFEYVCGGELFSHLRKAGRFENTVARFYVVEIVLALEYLHDLDVIYRDLKPENLLLGTHGHIKITDFGFAKRVTDRTWTLCGTPEYLAPEIIQSKGHGKGVDWWALGVLTYEMIAGYPPFYDDSPFGIYEKILGGRLAFQSHFEPNCKDFIKKLLTGDRTKRLGTLRNGVVDVKKHRWFKGIDWDLALLGDLPPPIVPDVQGLDDTRNFDNYPELNEEEVGPKDDPFKLLFSDFDCDTTLQRQYKPEY
eukprot:CFRG6227T1